MPTKKSDALKFLVAHHQEVEALLEAVEGATADTTTLRQLANEVSLHLTLKERVFYPAIVGEDLDWRFTEALKEHMALRRLLMGLVASDMGSADFRGRVQALKERLWQQFRDEEHDLLPQVGATLNRARLCEVGAAMRALAKQLTSVEPATLRPRRRAAGKTQTLAPARATAESPSHRKRKGA